MRKSLLWTSLFLVLFILSLDFWSWDDPIVLSALGLPGWVYYFILLQILFAVVFYFFSRESWNDPEDQGAAQ